MIQKEKILTKMKYLISARKRKTEKNTYKCRNAIDLVYKSTSRSEVMQLLHIWVWEIEVSLSISEQNHMSWNLILIYNPKWGLCKDSALELYVSIMHNPITCFLEFTSMMILIPISDK
ncbi:hypothetical protein Ddye_013678 [Dipteronia dyeriana]|uniref:Uncharacterized protein n=1 Tax=Dipteronia dyeriana TaxID=168575 RepID=A0AAD9X6V8_9ROSI|nr:hypothetical protein Ddye_013678 [Dipteronia dyeriana]